MAVAPHNKSRRRELGQTGERSCELSVAIKFLAFIPFFLQAVLRLPKAVGAGWHSRDLWLAYWKTRGRKRWRNRL